MSPREELVTAALLGTDRRASAPVDPAAGESDPAVELLERAAYDAAARRAGRRLPMAPPVPRAPRGTLRWASPEAQAVLRRILDQPAQVDLVNVWLATAAAYGVGVAPEQWPVLVRLAARSTDVDRADLRAALGARGLWFVAQNPQWTRLESALRTSAPRATPAGPAPDPQVVREHPEAIFAAPGPWSLAVLEAVLSVLASGRLQRGALTYAQAVGARVGLEHHPRLRSAARAVAEQPPAGGQGRNIRDAFAALEATVSVRAEIHDAFQAPPTPDPVPDDPEEPR